MGRQLAQLIEWASHVQTLGLTPGLGPFAACSLLTYLFCDFLLRVSASSWSLQRKGKGLLLQWLVLLPELPSGQLLPNPSTTAAQLGHQQAQGGEAHTQLRV